MWRSLFFLMVMLCAGTVLFSQTAGNRRYVAVQTVTLKDSTGFFAKDLGSLAQGAEVTIIREDGKWTQVRTGNIDGWVASSSLSARRITASNSSVTASEVAMAGKGFSPATEIEYQKDGLDYSMVDFMEKTTVAADDLLQFVTEGRLARGE